jgi:hypothetical protein
MDNNIWINDQSFNNILTLFYQRHSLMLDNDGSTNAASPGYIGVAHRTFVIVAQSSSRLPNTVPNLFSH